MNDIKTRIGNERLRITLSANAAMFMFYWDIGTLGASFCSARRNKAGRAMYSPCK